jgi:hypothetical protein
VRGRNIDINKVETRTKVQHFISQAFKKNIAIWSCILLEDAYDNGTSIC